MNAEDGITSASRRIREGVTGTKDHPEYNQQQSPQPDVVQPSSSKESIGRKTSPGGGERISNSAPMSNPEYVDLHELAKGWKAALSWCVDPHTRHEARRKNDRGNLPLAKCIHKFGEHSSKRFRAHQTISKFVAISATALPWSSLPYCNTIISSTQSLQLLIE